MGHFGNKGRIIIMSLADFKYVAAVCSESELPNIRSHVGIRDFQLGNLTTGSLSKLEVSSSGVKKVSGYENRKIPPVLHVEKKVKVVKDMPSDVEDAIKIEGGRTVGSCGAPYF